MTRIHEVPVYVSRNDEIEAQLYNLWRRAKLHLSLPLRIELAPSKQMVLIIDQDHWEVVDQNQYDLPMLAWLDFRDAGRSSLHTPVACKLNDYHYMASRLRGKALQTLKQELNQRLKADDSNVIPLKPD